MDRSFFQNLETERLLLKNISLDDAEFFYQSYSNPDVCRYLVDEEPLKDIDEAVKWINMYTNEFLDHNRWVIVNKATGIRMGTCGFHNWEPQHNKTEIGYELMPENWGKGFITEALKNAFEFAFVEMKVHRIYAHVHTENVRSMRVLEKLGFKREGLLRDELFFRGKYYDHYLYALIKTES